MKPNSEKSLKKLRAGDTNDPDKRAKNKAISSNTKVMLDTKTLTITKPEHNGTHNEP